VQAAGDQTENEVARGLRGTWRVRACSAMRSPGYGIRLPGCAICPRAYAPGASLPTRSQDQLQVLMQLSEASQLSGSSGESQNQSTIGTNEEVMLTASFVNGHDGQDFPSPSAAAMFLQHQVQIDIHAVLPAQQVGARAVSAHGEETSLCASKQRPPVVTNESVASSSSSTVLECVSAPSVDAAVAGAKKKGCKLGNSNNTSLEALAALPQEDVEQDEEVAHIHDAALRMISVRKKVRDVLAHAHALRGLRACTRAKGKNGKI
jgi:hypothetical protein